MGGRENAFLKAKKKMENVRLKVLLSLSLLISLCVCLVFWFIFYNNNISFSFCSSLRKRLSLTEALSYDALFFGHRGSFC
jgi:hypothetical protein